MIKREWMREELQRKMVKQAISIKREREEAVSYLSRE